MYLTAVEFNVQETPASFITNYDDVKSSVEKGVEEYKIDVTLDNINDAKKMATDLNKLSGTIKKVAKDKIAAASTHIDEFKDQVEELDGIIQGGRTFINDQVNKFEDEYKAQCLADLEEYGKRYAAGIGLVAKFQNLQKVEFSDLVTITDYKGKKGDLRKKFRDGVESKLDKAKSYQVQIENRLLVLENECHKAGLKAVLTEDHVAGFLYDPSDEVYQTNLNALISSELSRQEHIEKKVLEEKAAKDEAAAIERQAEIESEKPKEHIRPISNPSSAETEVRVVVARFEVEVKKEIHNEKITGKLKSMLEDAGITSCTSIEVV